MVKFSIDFLTEFSEKTLIDELNRIAQQLGRDTLSRRDIDEHGRMSSAVVLKRFGSLRVALQAAGLRPTRFMKASDEELLDVLEDLWVASLEQRGRRPERADLATLNCFVSADTIVRRFGSWKKALLATAERAERRSTPDEASEAAPVQALFAVKTTQSARSTISVRKRFLVLKRDRYTCCLCKATGVPIEVDHIVPVARGGTDALHNLQTLCMSCTRGKRDSIQ